MNGELESIGTISGTLSVVGTITGTLSSTGSISGELTIPTYVDVDIYDGATTVTPSEETQVLQTTNKTITENITINPIPSNYGRIVYNGSYIRLE